MYGPDYERVKTTLNLNQLSTNVETRIFVGDYEKQIRNGIIREIHYINGGNGLCAIVVKENDIFTTYPVYTDHLGSINTVTNVFGDIIAEQNFDAWGRERDPNNWNSYAASSKPDWLYRGYTGHEMLPYFNLINMNGRMYDPIIGRMLSPDNYVMPTGTQGYNRYTYANNNPLMYIDPDGNVIHLIIGAIIGSVVNLASSALQGRINSWGDGFKAFGIGAAQGALGAAIGYGGFGMDAGFNALWAGYGSSSSIIGSIATGIGSSFIPSIPFGDNFSISPSFAFSTHGLSAGLSASASFGKGSLGIGFSNSGSNQRFSYGGGYGSFSYFRNKFTGDNPQSTGTFAYSSPKFSLSWENDLFGISGDGRKDRWRTNGIGFSVQLNNGSSIGLGTTLMTGEDNDIKNTRYPNEHSENASTLRRGGLFYATYKSAKGQTYSAGVNNERWRYSFHKAVHSVTRDGVFTNLSYIYPSTGFVRYGNANPFTYFY